MSHNNSGGPFDPGGIFGSKVLDSIDEKPGVKCPKCRARDFSAITTQYALIRTCRKCNTQWSGGSMAVAKKDMSSPPPAPGIPVPDDLPVEQYTGAAFRDPSKNSDGDY